jgi:hypothetical protein
MTDISQPKLFQKQTKEASEHPFIMVDDQPPANTSSSLQRDPPSQPKQMISSKVSVFEVRKDDTVEDD